jgi:electron transfer flavoprotein alpha subunit
MTTEGGFNKVWIVLQLRNGGVHPMSREALAAGQRLAAESGGSAEAVVLGADVAAVAEEISSLDLAAIRVIDHPALESYTPGAFVAALAAAIREHSPDAIVFPHSYQTVDYAPRLAQALDAAIVPEVVSFRHDGGQWVFRRPVFGGKLQSEVRVKDGGPTLLSVQAGAFSASDLKEGSAPVEALSTGEEDITADRELLGVEEVAGEQVDLSAADMIVAVGRAIGGTENMGLIEDLASALGAEIGASRPVIDSGWLPRDRQIGSSGQTVTPKLYVAVGISGAIQHLVGMKGSQTVVAINKDPSAPIFGIADYGIVGDLNEVVPALIEAIQEAKTA